MLNYSVLYHAAMQPTSIAAFRDLEWELAAVLPDLEIEQAGVRAGRKEDSCWGIATLPGDIEIEER